METTNPIEDCQGLPREYVEMIGCVLERQPRTDKEIAEMNDGSTESN